MTHSWFSVSSFLFASILIGCGEEVKTIDVGTGTTETETLDADGDGFYGSEDCDDQDALTNPNAQEVCDGIDNNCDGQIDEGVRQNYYEDADGDGFGGVNYVSACVLPDGYVPISNDCNDSNAAVYPSAPEICDGIDNNCDGSTDENLSMTWYLDYDGDGYGDVNFPNDNCNPGNGYVANNDDCDDLNAAAFPGNAEICDGIDNDCDGDVDANLVNTYYQDADGDGFGDPDNPASVCNTTNGLVENADDCNDNAATAYPGATETCDNIDNNCDGTIDEGMMVTWYLDADGDTFGNPLLQTQSCVQPAGYVANPQDCNDSNPTISPFAVEICDTIDNNCDGVVNEGMDAIYYLDADGDGYGNLAVQQIACAQPSGYVSNGTDCNDNASTANPLAVEICDTIDNDCDGLINEDLNVTYYLDADGDGFGDTSTAQVSCTPLVGYVTNGGDCNDNSAAANPVATEICDTLDNNCDGLINEDLNATYYLDADGDGYGNVEVSQIACAQPSGYVRNATDCNDNAVTANPLAVEICDNIDNNCDGIIDETMNTVYYLDADGDGYGNPTQFQTSCLQPTGYVTNGNDCDDTSAAANPVATEICDTLDNDCDGLINEDLDATYYIDADRDGYGNASVSVIACTPPAGYVLNPNDCNDASASASPVAVEVCDGIDNDCNGQTDESVEQTYYLDYDQDGFGDPNQPYNGCSQPQFYTTNAMDCNDSSNLAFPNASEICDTLDNNCDGTVDEGFTANGLYADIENCGTCGNDCSEDTYSHASAICDSTLSTPACSFECDSGYLDANSNANDGCECLFISTDDPNFDGIDQNCDGTDGDHSLAIHVSASQGSASGTGSWNDPVDTISAGLLLAQSNGLGFVLVESGNYTENLTMIEGIALMGSMDANFTYRNLNDPSVVEGSANTPVLSAVNIATETIVDGFSFYSPATQTQGASVMAVYLENCTDQLTFANNIVVADDAIDGVDGDVGADGSDGSDGEIGMSGGQFNCSTTSYDGGAGGTNTCSGSGVIDGGDGASEICPSVTLRNGTVRSRGIQPSGVDGSGTSPGVGGVGTCDNHFQSNCGLCDVDACSTSGEDGTSGGDGTEGSGGLGANLSGIFNGSEWVTVNGVSGITGTDGSGGGGGGAGGGGFSSCSTSQNHAGGAGGGGGAGGCAGEGGTAGTGGGSSFGIFVYCTSCTSLPTLYNNDITAGDGGNGGDGGDGGLGGLGGLGGVGGVSNKVTAFCSRDGGYGGDGGFGGDGGGGGGGAGGSSFAVYVEGYSPDADWVSASNDLDAGLPGLGGRGGRGGSRPNDGGNGVNGSNGDQNW